MRTREATIEEISKLINANFYGNNILIDGLGLSNRQTRCNSIISYIASKNYVDSALSNPAVKGLLVTSGVFDYLGDNRSRFSCIIVENPEDEFYKIHHKLYNETTFYDKKTFDPVIGSNCNIHRTAVIEKGVIIGDNVTIGANSVINTNVTIGNNTSIGCCSIIGSEGFQVLRNKHGVPYNVKHVGGATIGNNVWIGDNVTICNSIFEDVLSIGNNCQIDNHAYIAHNCIIGNNNVIAAGVIMLGSSEVKNDCWIAPGALIMNRVVVNNKGFVGASSMVNSKVDEGVTVVGTPAIPINEFSKIWTQLKKMIDNKLK